METQLYPGIAFSPPAALTDNIGAGDTIIPVSDAGSFPPAPNLATIGADEDGETILYAAKTATALSGCVRGVEGEARAWSAGEPIARNWTAKDHADLIAAVREAKEASDPAGTAEDVLEGHQEDVAAHGALFSAKQNKLTGQPGQAVGFGADGAAKAVPGWSNPNLLDNWYFADPINQRGQAEYTGNGYGIDRWKDRYVGGDGVKELTDAGIHLKPGFATNGLVQIFETFKHLSGKTVTFSILALSVRGTLRAHIAGYDSSDTYKTLKSDDLSAPGILQLTVTLPDMSDYLGFFVRIYNVNAGTDSVIAAVKLELGSVQTLACQDTSGNWVLNDPPPNKALELAKCQRYQLVLPGTNSVYASVGVGTTFADKNFQINVPLPTSMRVIPTINMVGDWFIRGGGGSYGFNTSNMGPIDIFQMSANIVTLDAKTNVSLQESVGINQAIELVRNNNNTAQIVLDANL